jgi:hypothetical protein
MKSAHALIPVILFGALTIFCVANVNICEAQTNPVQFKTVLVTNWVKPRIVMRVVDGKLYNTSYSKLWVHPAFDNPPKANPLDNPWNVISYSLQVEFVDTDKIICGVWRDEYKHETYTAQLGLDDSTHIKSIVIYHYPNPHSLITGQKIDPLCLKVSNCISNGISLEAYDCGTQYTNLIPVVTKEKIEAEPINSVKQSQ